MILAAAIGPTTSHVALFDQSGSRLIRVETFRTLEHDGVAAVLQGFLGSKPGVRLDAAGVGVTVAWPAYAHELAEVFEIPAVVVVDGLDAHVHHLRDLARLAAERLATAPTPHQKWCPPREPAWSPKWAYCRAVRALRRATRLGARRSRRPPRDQRGQPAGSPSSRPLDHAQRARRLAGRLAALRVHQLAKKVAPDR